MVFEIRRKILHTTLAVLFIFCAPYVTQEIVIGAGIGLFVFFALLRILGIFAHLGAVPRITFGELFFALGVLGTALLTDTNMGLFQMAILILAFADPLAALVGIRFGRHIYSMLDEKRSIEGSLACFVVSVVILLSFGVALPTSLLTAGILTGVEAISLRGSDNLFLPLITVVLVQYFA